MKIILFLRGNKLPSVLPMDNFTHSRDVFPSFLHVQWEINSIFVENKFVNNPLPYIIKKQ